MRHLGHRFKFVSVQSADELFTPKFVEYLLALHDKFSNHVHELLKKRTVVLDKALNQLVLPTYLPTSEANTGDWKVPPVPKELKTPGIEISGPASITSMFINAVNPGPDGTRAEGYLDDDEDSSGHRLIDTITATRNRLASVKRTLYYYDKQKDKEYHLQDGNLPFLIHRERGLHLNEPEVKIDAHPVSAAILGTALTLFYVGRAQFDLGQGVYFYLPKLESAEEARFWKEFFDYSREHLKLPKTAMIRAIPLIESLPLAYQMEESLYSLGPYAVGLNAARWDFKASILEFIMSNPNSVWPDRFEIDVKTTDFIANIFRRLVAICLKRGAIPIGGMATALPSKNPEINKLASDAIEADKQWEASQGFLRAWVAHIFHMNNASKPFKELHRSGWKPPTKMLNPDNYPIKINPPDGRITIEGTRRNVRVLLEYIEGWLNGRGAKGIDSLSGKPGLHPMLMEDLATGRISVAQIAQRIIHHSIDSNSEQVHNFTLVKQLFLEELEDILRLLKLNTTQKSEDTAIRYKKAARIGLRWVKNYTQLNFRSLGSYTKGDLEIIAASDDAF